MVAVERLPSIEGAVEILMRVTFLRGTKAPIVKGSWPEGPEGLARRSEKAPLSGELAAKQTERLSLSGTTSPSRRSAEPPPLEGEALYLRTPSLPL